MEFASTHRDSTASRKRQHSSERHARPSEERKRHHRSREQSVSLPFQRPQLHKNDFNHYRALFAEYLDLQKNLDIDELDHDEVKGRWKSFLGKWNRGELAEGWYDPDLKRRADERALEGAQPQQTLRTATRKKANIGTRSTEPDHKTLVATQASQEPEAADEDEDYGPSLPCTSTITPTNPTARSQGPSIPTLQDLQDRNELSTSAKSSTRKLHQAVRKAERDTQRQREEELAPRAAPGTRERQLEKKRDVAQANKSFAQAKEADAQEVGEGDLMGEDGAEGFKAQVKAKERVKNEREIRKEEILRAREVEREERLAVHRAKEEGTMEMLKELARKRFGGVQ